MPSDLSFRLTVEDVFSIRGMGTVVTGRVDSGTLHVGDTVEIVGQSTRQKTTVDRIEMFRKQVDQAETGDMVGVFLQGIERGQVQRGYILAGATPGFG
ncbi:MAG: hypothetical protein JXA89_25615 [Anaerolineae bacterium]|nr:hypothetical protein [Anaerolineae bacterium]